MEALFQPTDANDSGRKALLLFAEHLAVRPVDKMKPGTRLADHGFVGGLTIVRCGVFRHPVLHVHPGSRTFEYDVAHLSRMLASSINFVFVPDQLPDESEANTLAVPGVIVRSRRC